MLYLEDYLEMIEHLPQELRDRFTEMRELDLQVQNSMDSLEKRVKIFFSSAKKMKAHEKEAEYDAIRNDYYKTLEDADEKAQLAHHMYELVGKYVRRLDQETHKFKMELEADNMGITEILEKRSHEMDSGPTNSWQKENRYSFSSGQRNSHHEKRQSRNEMLERAFGGGGGVESKRLDKEPVGESLRGGGESLRGSGESLRGVGESLRGGGESLRGGGESLRAPSYSLPHIGAGGTAIAAAASQAIAATQQMQQGRRTASLKASYEAIHGGAPLSPHQITISKELAGAAQTAIAAIQDTHKKHKKKAVVGGGLVTPPVGSPASVSSPPESSLLPSVPPPPLERRNAEPDPDPNEPRYCICNQVAFGTMVACDNKSCPYEWYHYPCVGITDKPKGKWYCPHCTAAMKRRNRKN